MVTYTAAGQAWPDTGPISFLVTPYVPRHGITLLYGKKGVGKSPFTWALARAVSTGEPFMGLPTQRGTVLYIEADSPLGVVRMRLEAPVPWATLFTGIFNVVSLTDHVRPHLRQLGQELNPDLVIVNTLRKVHALDDKDSHAPTQVYGAFRSFFPTAALFFVHHERKTPWEADRFPTQGEEFSGSLAWINDVQSGIKLGWAPGRPPPKHLGRRLQARHVGSQVSELAPPLSLLLAPDGFTLTPSP